MRSGSFPRAETVFIQPAAYDIFFFEGSTDYFRYQLFPFVLRNRKSAKERRGGETAARGRGADFSECIMLSKEEKTPVSQSGSTETKPVMTAERYQDYGAVIRVMHEALHSGMWSMDFDPEGRMVSVEWSDEFRRMLGYTDTRDFPNTLEAWSDKLHEEDKTRVLKEFHDTVSDYTNRKSYDVEYRLRVKSGEWRWYHAMGRLIRREDGSPRTYIGMFVDITGAKEQEQKLIEALHRAEEANRAKSAFLSHMSHDIRTPINGIMGMTSIALRHIDEKERVLDCLEKIDDASEHLLMLINDVLDMSRIEAGKMQVNHAPFDLSVLVSNCSSIISGQLKGRDIHYTDDVSGIVHKKLMGDELHLRQVLINILGNSVKFTNDGGSIRLSATETDSGNGTAWFRFIAEDTGIGMSPEFLPKLFEAFTQEENGSRTHYTGTGLGMAITKQFVELLGGTIQVESELNVGTRFTIDLPFEIDPSQEQKPAENAEMADLSGMKILVAEDNEINMEIVTVLLSEAGVSVTQAFNGQEAVDRFKESAPGTFDAILMDVMMPVMDGLEASRTIRALDREDAGTVPILAATANAYQEDIRRTREAGMDAHVSKPLDIAALTMLLQKFRASGRKAADVIEQEMRRNK